MNQYKGIAANSRELPSARSRLQGVLMIAAVLVPMVAAYIVYYTGYGIPDGRINQGELLHPPVNILNLPFSDLSGKPQTFAGEKAKWRYLIIPGGECDTDCEKILYTSRQVHIRLGDKANRVERLLVVMAPPSDGQLQMLQREHPRLRLVRLEERAWQQLHQQTEHRNISDPRLLLVDQQGFAMMAYDNRHSGNQLLKDIKRLLKYSYEQ
ncbi:hypothetical protein [Microbulbifer thermotolerans]|uniref:Cytochrome oxidase Cu insertion factor, SCO1/SenC/PrrC family n=1 Tax=Microbulbifer thermotolerans TaxID=252514 RepID=A0A143HHM2_MICTH|nr:hypothetical protein [Microbulbifer thermotolerans]AMX01218.1 hypothetical protein A3224_00240 [Microbulbifer thermotolerans]